MRNILLLVVAISMMMVNAAMKVGIQPNLYALGVVLIAIIIAFILTIRRLRELRRASTQN